MFKVKTLAEAMELYQFPYGEGSLVPLSQAFKAVRYAYQFPYGEGSRNKMSRTELIKDGVSIPLWGRITTAYCYSLNNYNK